MITELVHKLKMGYISEKQEPVQEQVFDLWRNDTDPNQFRSRSNKIPPPNVHLPGLIFPLLVFALLTLHHN